MPRTELEKSNFSELSDAIRYIEQCIPSPDKGLPEEVFLFASRLTPLVNVDILIRNEEGHVLLTWRDDKIFGSGWHVPGGCVRIGEYFADRIVAVARGELGVSVFCYSTPLGVFETIDNMRPFRKHHVSLLFECKLMDSLDPVKEFSGKSSRNGAWLWHPECPPDLLQKAYGDILWDRFNHGND